MSVACGLSYDRFLQDLQGLVDIDSGSGHAEGLAQVAGFFTGRFERLGWSTRVHQFEGGAVPCLEAVNRPGSTPYDLLLLGHMDTVFPVGTARERPFTVRDGRGYGPGVCDMKAGLVTVLHAAEAAQAAGVAGRLSLCVAFNSDEEVGSRVSRPWFEALARRSRRVLVFEPCRATGHRVLQRKGVGGYTIVCRGRAAHAGVEPEKGANAVSALAGKVLAAARFAQPELGTTVNVTTIHGGRAANVIPDYAAAGFDVRVADPDEARRVEACFRGLAGEGADGVRCEVSGGINRMPMVPTEATRRLWAEVQRIGEGLGMEMPLVETGGGSDGNFTAALGIPTIDAMGPRGGRAHSPEEFLELDGILPNLRLAVEILSAAAAGHLP